MDVLKKVKIFFVVACELLFGFSIFAQETAPLLPAAEIEKVSYAERAITLKVRCAPGTLSAGVYQDGELIRTEMFPLGETEEKEESFSLPVQILKDSTEFYVSAISQKSEQLLKSAALVVSTSDFEPSQPYLSLQDNEVLSDVITLSGQPDERVISASVLVNGEVAHRENMDPGNPFSFSVALPYGESALELLYENAWGVKNSVTVKVWNLGKLPDKKTFILVDKSEFRLYFIKQGVLFYLFPVALGTPKTPTHEGWWFVGKKEVMANPYSAWGVLRMLLYTRTKKGKVHWSGYAIHGTNNPSSIGKEASHGCVRLFNEDVIKLSSIVGPGTEVFIRD